MKPNLVITDITIKEELIKAMEYMKKEFPGIKCLDPDIVFNGDIPPVVIRSFPDKRMIWLVKMVDMEEDIKMNYTLYGHEYQTISIRSLMRQNSFLERHNKNLENSVKTN